MESSTRKWSIGLLISIVGAVGGAAVSSLFGRGVLLVISRFDFLFGISLGLVLAFIFIFGVADQFEGVEFGDLSVDWGGDSEDILSFGLPELSVYSAKRALFFITRWGALFLTVLTIFSIPMRGYWGASDGVPFFLVVFEYIVDTQFIWIIMLAGQLAWVVRADELR